MKQLTDSKAWALIAEMGWGKRTTDYKHLAETYFKLLGKSGMKKLGDFVSARVSDLGSAVKRYEDGNGDLEVGSDDGFSDLRYHVVGMGKDEWTACMQDPKKLGIRYKVGEYKESFAYAFQEPEPPRPKLQKQKDLRDLLTQIKVMDAELQRTQDQVDMLRERMSVLLRLSYQVTDDLKADWDK